MLKLDKLDYTKHPMAKQISKISVMDYYPNTHRNDMHVEIIDGDAHKSADLSDSKKAVLILIRMLTWFMKSRSKALFSKTQKPHGKMHCRIANAHKNLTKKKLFPPNRQKRNDYTARRNRRTTFSYIFFR